MLRTPNNDDWNWLKETWFKAKSKPWGSPREWTRMLRILRGGCPPRSDEFAAVGRMRFKAYQPDS